MNTIDSSRLDFDRFHPNIFFPRRDTTRRLVLCWYSTYTLLFCRTQFADKTTFVGPDLPVPRAVATESRSTQPDQTRRVVREGTLGNRKLRLSNNIRLCTSKPTRVHTACARTKRICGRFPARSRSAPVYGDSADDTSPSKYWFGAEAGGKSKFRKDKRKSLIKTRPARPLPGNRNVIRPGWEEEEEEEVARSRGMTLGGFRERQAGAFLPRICGGSSTGAYTLRTDTRVGLT